MKGFYMENRDTKEGNIEKEEGRNMEGERKNWDLVIIGGGPAGLAAAVSARQNGIVKILILERDRELGGILNQCIHNGFGLHTFQEELTGPEYADRFIRQVEQMKISNLTNTMVLHISEEKVITYINGLEGVCQIQAKAIVLAMGCRERPRGALNIPGFRPAGIYSAGTAQRLVNMEGYLPGKEVVILGSGDIGLIMARRMTLEGAHVRVVAELMPYSGGLKRNIVQCLEDYHIPLKLSHTVVEIQGKERVEGVILAEVDQHGKIIPGTEESYSCDTLLLSVGLIPENELSKEAGISINPLTSGPYVKENLETSVEGIFACGNVLHVHDLVDHVSDEAKRAGRYAAEYLFREEHKEKASEEKTEDTGWRIKPGHGVRYTVPSSVCLKRLEGDLILDFRLAEVYRDSHIVVRAGREVLFEKYRKILTPGEMETVKVKREMLEGLQKKGNVYLETFLRSSAEAIWVCVEEA